MLIVPLPEEAITLVVPAIRAADVDKFGDGVAKLIVTDSTSHEVYNREVDITEVTTFSLTIPDITLGLPAGQYTYVLGQWMERPLSLGILQVGLTAAGQQVHNYEPNVIRYERETE